MRPGESPRRVETPLGGFMRRLPACLMFALLVVLNSKAVFSLSQIKTEGEKISDDGGTALTIYNQIFFVAREHVPLELKPGVNHTEFAGVTSHLEPDSVILRDPGGRALHIVEQNYRNDPVSQELLLSFYEGKTIDFVVGRNADGSDIKMKAKIVRSGYVPINYLNGYPQQAAMQPIVE